MNEISVQLIEALQWGMLGYWLTDPHLTALTAFNGAFYTSAIISSRRSHL